MNIGILDPKKTAFVLIDIQDKLVPAISNIDEVIRNSNKLVNASEILGIPLLITEQYPKGLGNITEKITLPHKHLKFEKISFSCFGSEDFSKHLDSLDVDTLVLFGLESHICVLKTALDALSKNYSVHVVADAVSSRSDQNNKIGLERMKQSNIFITSTEMILFQLQENSGTNEFKQISKLIR